MREHPMLFTDPMVQAILDGQKTVTRRVPSDYYMGWEAGDTIYVRECWRKAGVGYVYRATSDEHWMASWKPSIHMPRKAARIFLRILSVREERLHAITKAGIAAEGVSGSFETLWDAINADRGAAWATNPKVAVIEFERITT